jgi:hypothetical protein
MEAGTVTSAPPSPPSGGDIFDRIGDAVGNTVRDGARRIADYATVTSPLLFAARGATDPHGTADSVRRVGNDALNALSLLVPGFGVARAVLSTDAGRRAAEEGAKGAVDVATVANPVFAAGRFIVDPDGTRESFEKAGKAVKDFAESPFTTYGMAKRAYEFAKDHPKEVEHAAKVGFDIATLTNPVLAAGRGVFEGLKGIFGGD